MLKGYLLCAGTFALVALVASAGAMAATVRAPPPSADGVAMTYVAEPGERNDVLLAIAGWDPIFGGPPLDVIVRDAGAPITPGVGCTAIDEHAASCAVAGGLRIVLGDLDDSLSLDVAGLMTGSLGETPLVVEGGDGNDRLNGAPGLYSWLQGGPGDDELMGGGSGGYNPGDRIDGGPGDDRLSGGAGFDVLDGGGGDDELGGGADDDLLTDGDLDGASSAAPDSDLLDGGLGADTVSYARRTDPVSVDLQAVDGDGAPGENDSLVGIEAVVGGAEDDQLAGDERANALNGGGGQNRLTGRGGNDSFSNAGGRVSCGSGKDTIMGEYHFVSGSVDQFVRKLSSRDFLLSDCERIRPSRLRPAVTPYPRQLAGGALQFRISCRRYEDEITPRIIVIPCGGEGLKLHEASARHRLIGRAPLPVGPWTKHRVTVRLTALGHRLASRRGGVRTTIRLGQFSEPEVDVVRWTIRLTLSRQM